MELSSHLLTHRIQVNIRSPKSDSFPHILLHIVAHFLLERVFVTSPSRALSYCNINFMCTLSLIGPTQFSSR